MDHAPKRARSAPLESRSQSPDALATLPHVAAATPFLGPRCRGVVPCGSSQTIEPLGNPGLGVRLVVVTATGLPILGLIAFEVIYGFCNLFVHSDIRIAKGRERCLGWLLVTPSLHRVHHSERPEILNRNFGTVLSIWDRLGRTLLAGSADTPVALGLPGQHGRELGLGEALRLPLTAGPDQKAS